MDDAGRADDRLPWLETPRAAKTVRPRRAARHARTPLLLLLGLFLASTVAIMAFLAGRGSVPIALAPRSGDPPPVAVEPVRDSPPVPVPPAPSEPVVASPSAAAQPSSAATPRATRPKAKRQASARRSQRVAVHRNTKRARAVAPLYQWPTTSAAGPSGRVIQLGAFVSGGQTMAAWRRLRRVYPYLATLPRKVTVVSPGEGRQYYRLRIGTPSAGHARAICNNLHRIGRGCIVV